MRVHRSFEKRGPLYLPRYDYRPDRLTRYRKRHPFYSTVSRVNNASVSMTGTGTAFNLTISAPTVGNTLIVMVTIFTSAFGLTISSVSHGSDTLLTGGGTATNVNNGTGIASTSCDGWYVLAGNTTTTITVNLSGAGPGGTFGSIRCYEYSGTNLTFSACQGTTNISSGSSTLVGASTSISTGNGFLVAVGTDHVLTFTGTAANGGFTFGSIGDTLNGDLGAELLNQSAASYAVAFTESGIGTTGSICTIAFYEGAAAGVPDWVPRTVGPSLRI